uniref:Cation-independent mannose-6-phosphate receptor n=1 Tax=Phallusia mammillata TaxID=59560 RepID=A0A6F9DFJ9_9ASCI|nr:cation-independent mannose-6-phosphate receptor [Phallusia mammillata]
MQKLATFLCLFATNLILLTFTEGNAIFQSCSNVHGRNLTDLQGIWEVHHKNNEGSTNIYYLNLCSSLPNSFCTGTSSVCLKKSTTGTGLSLGDFDKPPSIVATSDDAVTFYLEYNTTRHCTTNTTEYSYRSSITFECATTLGSPEVISADGCSVDFLWETSLACRPSEYDATKEVRCYGYDTDDKKRDLNSLIKKVGGYFITDPSSSGQTTDGLYINVCRDIKTVQGDEMHSMLGDCPQEAAGCLVKDGHSYAVGIPASAVNITNENRLVLKYESQPGSAKPSSCSSFSPQVIVTFVCPGNTRGGSKAPILTSSLNCQYTVEWWTEAACPADFVTSNKCGLDIQRHGIELDLSPLTSTTKYTVSISNGGSASQTSYFLNVCDRIHVPCSAGDTSATTEIGVCQAVGESGYNAGSSADYQVQYIDEQLSITYKNGGRCNSNGLRRRSIIMFHCNKTAGVGQPTFNHELHCVYYFDWQTEYACVSQPVCHVTDSQGQTFDLSPLTKIQGGGDENWEALRSDVKSGVTQPRYFVNVCGEILRDQVTNSCLAGSAVCRISGSKHVSFGSFAHYNITRQNNKLILIYSSGENCPETGVGRTTTITLYCRAGDLEGSPVVKYMSSDGCNLHLTWYTAAACPMKAVTGDNCIVSDEESGLTFDLRRLTKSTKEPMYKVSTAQYDYFLNVCDKLSGTPCNNNDKTGRPATCQVEQRGEKHAYTTGQSSQVLTYYNGFVKLLYKDGDSYRNHLHNRSTQISFLCDTKAGAGHPQFVSEGNYTYLFNWYTSYVCPAASTQCMATDPSSGDQYDLSSLAKSEDDEDENWTVMGDSQDGQPRKKYYLNVCRPVNEVQGSGETGCDALAGACQTTIDAQGQERIGVSSLGRPTSPPVIESPGHLLLKYANGSSCVDGGKAGKFVTNIHFVCQKGALTSSPRFLSSTACSATFMWDTEAACVITSNTGNKTECEVSSKNSQHMFNLQPLVRDAANPYVVTGTQGTYEINVCGNVTDCKTSDSANFAACKKLAADNFTQNMLSHTAPTYSDDGSLSIKYTRRAVTTGFEFYKISFICNPVIAKGKPTLNTVGSNYVLFDFQTSLACQPHPVDCLVTDDFGNQFDLTPLSESIKPWTFVDDHHRSFYLSVCRPLPPVDGCTGSGFGACFVEQLDSGKFKGHNLGLVQSNPEAVSNQGQGSAVSITYMGGDICKSDTKRRYSTRIIFQCSQEIGASPVLQPNGDACEFLFTWSTPAACPVKEVKGYNCTVTDPLYHMTFDLSSLNKATDYLVPAGDEWNFNVNICSKLKQATGECVGSGSCQVKKVGEQMHRAGIPSTNLTYQDGVVTLKYLGGEPCHNNQFNRSSIFRFTCNHEDNTASSNGIPTFINESADCTYHFDWPTAKVCPPIKIVPCTATHNFGEEFDLSTLSSATSNYQASTRGDTGGRSYYINVCRTLLHQPGVTCPPYAAACVKNGNKYMSLGKVTDGPEFNGDTMRLVYNGGDKCESDPSKNYSTVITFQCKADAAMETTPVVITTDTCTVQMLWATRAACSVGSQTSSKGDELKPCTAVNPATDHSFNLSSLGSTSDIEVNTYDGRFFHINVCRKLNKHDCPDGTGSCLAKLRQGPYISAGQASSQLHYSEGSLSLHYSDGAVCEADNKYKQSTTISFVCHRSTAPHLQQPTTPATSPVYVGEDKKTCSYYFSWHTHLACELQYPCAVVSMEGLVPRVFDLSSLISESGHYLAVSGDEGDRTVYFINVCRPLEPIHGINCPAGASVCAAKNGTKPQSLGYIDPTKRHVFYTNGSVGLEYLTGRVCESHPTSNISTRIIFTCLSTAGKGYPRLTTVTDDCVYLFEWPTDVVCLDKKPEVPDKSCSFTDQQHNVFDLSRIKPINVTTTSGTYQISLCHSLPTSNCADSSVCRISADGASSSLGKTSTQEISASGSDQIPVQVKYTNGEKCQIGSGNSETWIMLRCDRNPESNPPTVIAKGNICRYLIYWPTPHVCLPPTKSCFVTDSGSGATYDLSLLSSLTHAWTFPDNDGNRYYLNLCRNMAESKCAENATLCRKLQSSQKIQNIGVLSTQSITVESKNKLMVRYSKGEKGICTDSDKLASVEISLTCNPSISAKPTFKRLSQDSCTFHIDWQTRIACENEPVKVAVNEGKFVDPKSSANIDISPLLRRSWIASGDMRQEGNHPTRYEYIVDFKGRVGGKCGKGVTVCQYNPDGDFTRPLGALNPPPTYVMSDETLEVTFKSNNSCGKDPAKKSHSLLSLRCSPYGGLGSPVFVYESMECGYFFEWYTSVMCVDIMETDTAVSPSSSASPTKTQTDVHEVADKHSDSVVMVTAVFGSLALICVLILIFHNAGRRRSFRMSVKRILGFGGSDPSYRYIRSGDDDYDEGTSLFDDVGDLQMQQETSLLGGGQRMHGSTDTAASAVPLSSIGGAAETDEPDDLFAVPDVDVKTSKRGKAPKPHRNKSKRRSPNPFEESDSDDLLPFLKDKPASGKSRAPGVGGEKQVSSYHDDDDEDLLEG